MKMHLCEYPTFWKHFVFDFLNLWLPGNRTILSITLPDTLPQIWSTAASLCTAGGAIVFFPGCCTFMIPEQADHPEQTSSENDSAGNCIADIS